MGTCPEPKDEQPLLSFFIHSSFSGPHVIPDATVKGENQEAEAVVWILGWRLADRGLGDFSEKQAR